MTRHKETTYTVDVGAVVDAVGFGITAGVVVALAGVSITDEPFRATMLIIALNVAHVMFRGKP